MHRSNFHGLRTTVALGALAIGMLAATSISATADGLKDAPAPFNKRGPSWP